MSAEVVHRAVHPELPDQSAWLSYLQPSLDANWHTNFGPVCRHFEAAIAHRYGGTETQCVSASSATAGLAACLIAHRIEGPVICPAFTFQATASAILMARAHPVIVDVDASSMIIEADALDKALADSGAKAAIILAPYGIKLDFSAHIAVCARHGARLVIDNASGLGIERNLPETELHVDEVYSLHATKPFNIGEGGMIFTHACNDPLLRAAMNFGLQSHTGTGADRPPYWGINGKLTEVHAAIGLAVLDEIDTRVVARQQMVARWIEALSPYKEVIRFLEPAAGVWQLYPIMAPDEATATALVKAAGHNGVELRRYYAPSLGNCTGMRRVNGCPVAADLASRAVTLPVRSYLSATEQYDLINRCLDAFHTAFNQEPQCHV